jgi:hypothetical protein
MPTELTPLVDWLRIWEEMAMQPATPEPVVGLDDRD